MRPLRKRRRLVIGTTGDIIGCSQTKSTFERTLTVYFYSLKWTSLIKLIWLGLGWLGCILHGIIWLGLVWFC